MATSPFVVSPNGAGEAVASFATSITFSGGTAIQAGDLIYVGVATDGTIAATGVSGSGLTFRQRATAQSLTNGSVTASLWTAVAAGSMSGFTVTAAMTAEFDDAVAVWAVIRGCTPTAPFDPNGVLPVVRSGAPPASPVYSTSLPDDLLLFFSFGENGLWRDPAVFGQQVTPSPPWEFKTGAGNSGGFGFVGGVIYLNSVSATQSGQTVGPFVPVTSASVFLVDALTADVGAPGLPIDLSCGPNTQTSITPQWQQGSGPTPTSYTLQWRQAGTVPFTTITGITGLSTTITGLSPGTSYEWEVEAVDAGGNSGFTSSAFCSTVPPFPPTSPPLPPEIAAALNRGLLVVGDYRNGNLYALDLDQPTDNGTQRKWLRTWRAVQRATTKPQRFPRLRITMETGIQVPDGTNPQVMLRWSDDGGHSWSNQVIEAAGPTGATAQTVVFRRTGSTRVLTGLDRILELSSTDPFKVAIVGADWEVEGQP